MRGRQGCPLMGGRNRSGAATTVAMGGLLQLPSEPPVYAVKQGMAFRINKQFVGSQKINAQDRKSISKKNPDPGIATAPGSLPSKE
jgi:hypothetical protein